MTTVEGEAAQASKAPLPDYFADPDAVLKDAGVAWRYGRAPDYTKTRKYFNETKKFNHDPASLLHAVENLVKNWEIEASFKTRLSDWRTVNHDQYTFSMNGGKPEKADHMLKLGTYNAILTSSEYYCPQHSDFSVSHKTFKRMMPVFAWEVVAVYGEPPNLAFRWRHWGVMKDDYVGINNKGQKVTSKAHGGLIEIEGITTANLDEQGRITHLDTWFDPMSLFAKIAPDGKVNVGWSNTKKDDEKDEPEGGEATPNPKPENSTAEIFLPPDSQGVTGKKEMETPTTQFELLEIREGSASPTFAVEEKRTEEDVKHHPNVAGQSSTSDMMETEEHPASHSSGQSSPVESCFQASQQWNHTEPKDPDRSQASGAHSTVPTAPLQAGDHDTQEQAHGHTTRHQSDAFDQPAEFAVESKCPFLAAMDSKAGKQGED